MSPEELLITLLHSKHIAHVEAWIILEERTAIPILYGKIRHKPDGPTHEHKFKYRDGRWQKVKE